MNRRLRRARPRRLRVDGRRTTEQPLGSGGSEGNHAGAHIAAGFRARTWSTWSTTSGFTRADTPVTATAPSRPAAMGWSRSRLRLEVARLDLPAAARSARLRLRRLRVGVCAFAAVPGEAFFEGRTPVVGHRSFESGTTRWRTRTPTTGTMRLIVSSGTTHHPRATTVKSARRIASVMRREAQARAFWLRRSRGCAALFGGREQMTAEA